METAKYPPAIRQLQNKIDSIFDSLESAENYAEYLNGLFDRQLITRERFEASMQQNERATGHLVRQLDTTQFALKIALSNFSR